MEPRQVILERTYNAPASAVWDAITNKEKMKEWFFEVDAFKPEAGFKFTFTCIDHEIPYVHVCEIKEAIPGKKLAYTWAYADYNGESLVSIELFEEGAQTRLKLTHTGLETFPDDPFFATANYNEGWTAILGTNLKSFLER